jgi:protein disulfide-isomerase
MFRRNFFMILVTLFATSSFAAEGEWQTDYGKALEMARSQNRRVLLDFTGSDWCGPCIELRKRVFSRPEFRAYAEKNLILVEIDYPQRKKQSAELKEQNEKLSQQYGIDEKGFPTVILLDPEGKVVREFTGYDGDTTATLISWIEGKTKR